MSRGGSESFRRKRGRSSRRRLDAFAGEVDRMIAGHRALTGQRAERMWIADYVCDLCGDHALHVEISGDRDESHGLPPEHTACSCGGTLKLQNREIHDAA
jgi:hypothetical protein